jgi:L-lactate dehydrogenase complex protein LldF
MVNTAFKGWTAHRGELDFAAKTFNQMWNEKYPSATTPK